MYIYDAMVQPHDEKKIPQTPITPRGLLTHDSFRFCQIPTAADGITSQATWHCCLATLVVHAYVCNHGQGYSCLAEEALQSRNLTSSESTKWDGDYV
jgi:hypothetical protein